MRGRAAVSLFLLLLGIASFSGADCNPSLVTSGQFRSTTYDVAVDGTDLWVATHYGVALYDRTTTPPALSSSIALPGPTTVVRVANSVAWAASGTSLFTLEKEGSLIRRLQRLDLGESVNDLLAIGGYLFVAGSNGLTEVSLIDPRNPSLVTNPLPISGSAAYSLATDGTFLYAADGDSSIEVFNVSTPMRAQKIGTISSLPRSTSVSIVGARLLVSDGQQTDIFSGSGAQLLRLATLSSIGSSAVAAIDSSIAFVSGSGRRISAIDLSVPGSPVILFADEPSPAGGSVNRIFRLITSGGRLYAAAGDLGLLSWDISKLTSPYALRVYPTGELTSIAALGSTVIGSLAAGGLQQFSRSAAGTLTVARAWDSGHTDAVHDIASDLVLTSSAANLNLWSLTGTVPTAIATATAPANVRQAVLLGTTVWAVLDDRSIVRMDTTAAPPVVTKVNIDGASPSFIARDRDSSLFFALADLGSDATTTIRYVGSDGMLVSGGKKTLNGLASAGIAMSGATVAAFTFEGVVLVDFGDLVAGPPIVTVVPQTKSVLPQSLLLDGVRLFILAGSQIQIRNRSGGSLIGQISLASFGVGMALPASGGDSVVVATSVGPAIVSITAIPKQPVPVAAPNGNSYYKKVVVGKDHLYLFDGSRIDTYALSPAGAPSGFGTISGISGAIDLAATTNGLAVVSSGGRVTSLSPLGALRAQAQLNEGVDALPHSIFGVGGAIWVSLSRGCLTDTCDEKTVIFDDSSGSLVQTGTLTGSILDLTTSGSRAYALVALPGALGQLEIRVLHVADPYHPSVITSRIAEGTLPVSIAYNSGVIYVLGEKLYAYSEDSLTKLGEILGSFQTDPLGPRYADQRVVIDGSCALVTGRGLFPQLYSIASPTSWIAGARLEPPALTRSAVAANGTFYLLTDDSLEVWSSLAQPKGKRRASQ